MAKISTYPIISTPSINDLLIGTDVDNLNITKNFSIGDIASFIIGGSYVPYTGATTNVNLGTFNITSSGFIVNSGTAAQFLKANGTLDSTVYQPAGNYITQLSGEATASGPGNASVTLSNAAVIGKVLTGLTITGNAIVSTDSILTAFGKVQNQINTLVGGVQYKGTWNAATNTPALVSSVGVSGNYYVVSVAGNTNLNGITDWNLGDWAIFNGSAWEKVDNTDAVISVNGQVGAVVLTTTNISEGTNLYYTDTRARLAINLTTTGNSGAATYNNTNGFFNIPNYTLAGLGGVPSTRELTINGTTFDLSANRTWNVGTVTSVGTSAPLTGGTITGSGTIGITQAGVATDGYLSSIDWNTFNNKQNTITNPVTGTGTAFFLPMWSSASSLVNSPLSYLSDTFTFQYNSPTGGTVVFTNSGLTAYAYTIQMNNFGSPRSTVHSYTDGIVVQSIAGVQVSRVFANGNTVFGTGVADNGHKLELSGSLFVNTIANATIDTDRFLVSDSGVIKYRTGTELLSDIGAGVGSVTSVGLTMPSAFSVANSPITSSGTIAVTGAGIASQYIRGDGTLADFPTSTGGGSSVSYYLNTSISQGTIGGVAYKQLSEVPIFGAGTDISIAANGYVASFLTDAGDPNLLNIPAGNWNFETYFSSSSAGGTPSFYVELYRYDGTTFTLIASSVGVPELISLGTAIQPYFFTLAVPQTALALTDRLAIRYYVNVSGRTITLHTENGHLCQVVTTFSNGLTALNGLTAQIQYFQVGTSGTDFAISSTSATHTFNLPDASASARGVVTTGAQTIAGNKTTTQNIDVNGVMVGRGSSGGNAFNGIAGNTAVGTQALLSITTGYPNTALGSEALRNITTGANNIAIGEEAGKIDSGSGAANATSSTSIYIGNDTKPQTNGNTNEIVIGHGSEGNGSNTVTIGNSSTTLNKFFGTTLSDAFRLPSDGGGNQITIIENIGTIHEGTASINKIGFNSSNNIYFGKGLSNGGVIQWTNAAVRYYTLPDADGTIALTSSLSGYLPLTGGLLSTTNTSETLRIVNAGTGYALYVQSNSYFQGDVRFQSASNSILKTVSGLLTAAVAGTDYVIPSALSAYLPLAGGTLTGALNGTSATMSGSFFSNASSVSSFRGNWAGANYWGIGPTATNHQLRLAMTDVSGAYLTAPGDMTLLVDGAATFSGALNGTSASFTGDVLINKTGASTLTLGQGVTTNDYGRINFNGKGTGSGVSLMYMPIYNSQSGSPVLVSELEVAHEGSSSDNKSYFSLKVHNGTSLINPLYIASTGAATFSSTIGTAGDVTITKASAASFIANNTSASGKSYRLVSADDGKFYIQNTGIADLFSIASTGAATFSSSVTASGGASGVGLNIVNATNARVIQMGYSTGTGSNYIQVYDGSSFQPLVLNNALTIASTGAATFSSSVQATSGKFFSANGTTYASASQLRVDGGGVNNNYAQITFSDSALSDGKISYYPANLAADRFFSISARLTESDFVIRGNGNVGIGTASPGRLLTLYKSSTPILQFVDDASGTGSSNGFLVYIGGVNAYLENISNGFMSFQNNGAERMRITSDGLINIATSGTGRVNVMANPSNNVQMEFFNTSGGSVGSITVVGGGLATAYNTTSDYRLKEDLEETNGIDKVLGIKVYNYQWKGSEERMDGVLAHELAEVLPYAVHGEKDEVDEEGNDKMQGVDYSKIVPILIKAVQELKTEIDSLKNQIK